MFYRVKCARVIKLYLSNTSCLALRYGLQPYFLEGIPSRQKIKASGLSLKRRDSSRLRCTSTWSRCSFSESGKALLKSTGLQRGPSFAKPSEDKFCEPSACGLRSLPSRTAWTSEEGVRAQEKLNNLIESEPIFNT